MSYSFWTKHVSKRVVPFFCCFVFKRRKSCLFACLQANLFRLSTMHWVFIEAVFSGLFTSVFCPVRVCLSSSCLFLLLFCRCNVLAWNGVRVGVGVGGREIARFSPTWKFMPGEAMFRSWFKHTEFVLFFLLLLSPTLSPSLCRPTLCLAPCQIENRHWCVYNAVVSDLSLWLVK